MKLSVDGLTGEALIKGRKRWTKWAASRLGLTMDDWAGPWLEEMAKCGLPGEDFLVVAPNVSLTAWTSRPAQYADFSRALHLLLMVYGGETPETVVGYTPHGCRHVQVTAAAQLASQGIISEASMERLGHWANKFCDAATL